jgi:Holliday junction resolvase RusA-like endonuclease
VWLRYDVTPVAKPRMTRRDKWLRRPAVESYWTYKGTLQLLGMALPEPAHVVFVLPMPPSWSKAKRAAFLGAPHRQKPDLDNLHKGLLDALYPDDSCVAEAWIEKRWGESGCIFVGPLPALEDKWARAAAGEGR